MTLVVLVVGTVLVLLGVAVVLAGDLSIVRRSGARAILEAMLAPVALGLLMWWLWMER